MKKASVIFIGSGLAIASLWAASSGNISRKESAQKDVIRPNVPLVIVGEEPEENIPEPAKARTFMEKLLGWTSSSSQQRDPSESVAIGEGKNVQQDKKASPSPQSPSVAQSPSHTSDLAKNAPAPLSEESQKEPLAVVTPTESSFQIFWTRLKNVFSSDSAPKRDEDFVETHFAFIDDSPETVPETTPVLAVNSPSSAQIFWTRLKNIFSSDSAPKARRAENFAETQFVLTDDSSESVPETAPVLAVNSSSSAKTSSHDEAQKAPSLFSIWTRSATKGVSNIFGHNPRKKSPQEEIGESTAIYVPGDETTTESLAHAHHATNGSVVAAGNLAEVPEVTTSKIASNTEPNTTMSPETSAPEEGTDLAEEMESVAEAEFGTSSPREGNFLARFIGKIKSLLGASPERVRRSQEEFNETVFYFSDEAPEVLLGTTETVTQMPVETIVQTPITIAPEEKISPNPAAEASTTPVETIVETPVAEAVSTPIVPQNNVFVRLLQKIKDYLATEASSPRRLEQEFVETKFTYPDEEEDWREYFAEETRSSETTASTYAPFQYSAPKIYKKYLSGLFRRSKVVATSPEIAGINTQNPVAVVSSVAGEQRGPFKEAGKYEIEKHRTGLLLPLGEGNRLRTTDYPVQLILKKPALLSVDRQTEFQIQKILDIHELILSKGRIRLKLLDQSGLWTIRGRDMSLNLLGNADVAVDVTGDLITRVFILDGEAACMPSDASEPFHLKAGDHLSIGLGDTHQSEISSSTRDFLTSFLTFSVVEDYAKKMMAAEAYVKGGNLQWPIEGKVYSGVLCSFCGYAFGQKDQAYTYCPHCQQPLVLTKEAPKTEKANPSEGQPVSKVDSSSAWIVVAAQAPKPFGH